MNEREFELALAALIAGALHLGLAPKEIYAILNNAAIEASSNIAFEDTPR